MAKHLVWQERYNIGVDVIDKDHKKLFSILDKILANLEQEDKIQWVCQEGIKFFKDHAIRHFAREEAYMASIKHPELETHRRLHSNFRENTLPALEKELEQTGYSRDSIDHFLGVCIGWLVAHTLTEDRAITEKTASKWGTLLPNEAQDAMTQTIMQLLSDMFQLNPKVVSECYGGEKFGKGIYHRMTYGTKKEERWEIILAVEEKLIFNTIGTMMSAESSTLNEMMINASRYTARQFVGRVREHFPSEDLYGMSEENLLTYEQFKRVFERQNPQFSLLFATGGKGYLAYCVFAPHLVQDNEETLTSLEAENAMTEVIEYLKEETVVDDKKKILVVDDSEFALQAMKELLGKDYAVTLAKSGLSAIRCITLDRPDLVLLDYEMPVCNGSQVLEMIRAEEEFADIPVIFLTGRSDKESVQKVISLKPAGYLIKNLPPVEIKKDIDAFFARRKV